MYHIPLAGTSLMGMSGASQHPCTPVAVRLEQQCWPTISTSSGVMMGCRYSTRWSAMTRASGYGPWSPPCRPAAAEWASPLPLEGSTLWVAMMARLFSTPWSAMTPALISGVGCLQCPADEVSYFYCPGVTVTDAG